LVQALSYVHVRQLFVSTFVSSFRHERTFTVGTIYTKMQMQDFLSGILPGYSCKEGGRVEDGLLLEFPCTPTRTRSV
jgi:hypothetical protein